MSDDSIKHGSDNYALQNRGIIVATGTKAECTVRAFELKLVYDFGKRRNSLLPGVKIVEVCSSSDPLPR